MEVQSPIFPSGQRRRTVWFLLKSTPPKLLKEGLKGFTLIDCKLLQPVKVGCPRLLVTAAGMAILVRLWQPSNAPPPNWVSPRIVVSVSGSDTASKPVQPEKAATPISVTPSGAA